MPPSPTRHQALTWKPLACLGPRSLLHPSLSGLSQATDWVSPEDRGAGSASQPPVGRPELGARGPASGLCGGPISMTQGASCSLRDTALAGGIRTGPGKVPCPSALAAGPGLTVTPPSCSLHHPIPPNPQPPIPTFPPIPPPTTSCPEFQERMNLHAEKPGCSLPFPAPPPGLRRQRAPACSPRCWRSLTPAACPPTCRKPRPKTWASPRGAGEARGPDPPTRGTSTAATRPSTALRRGTKTGGPAWRGPGPMWPSCSPEPTDSTAEEEEEGGGWPRLRARSTPAMRRMRLGGWPALAHVQLLLQLQRRVRLRSMPRPAR